MVVFDQAYQEYVDAPDYEDGLDYCGAGHENILVFRTFSKMYGLAGLRVGYGIGRPLLLEPFVPASERFRVNAVAQTSGPATLQDESFMATAAQTAPSWGGRYLFAQLGRLGLFYVPSQTNFVWVEFSPLRFHWLTLESAPDSLKHKWPSRRLMHTRDASSA
jgi:histidinol-phosphate aminotransferase